MILTQGKLIVVTGQARLDAAYIEASRFATDLKISARAVPAVLSDKGAC